MFAYIFNPADAGPYLGFFRDRGPFSPVWCDDCARAPEVTA